MPFCFYHNGLPISRSRRAGACSRRNKRYRLHMILVANLILNAKTAGVAQQSCTRPRPTDVVSNSSLLPACPSWITESGNKRGCKKHRVFYSPGVFMRFWSFLPCFFRTRQECFPAAKSVKNQAVRTAVPPFRLFPCAKRGGRDGGGRAYGNGESSSAQG